MMALALGAVAGGGMDVSEPAWESARQHLIRLLREQAVRHGPVTLASGTVTDVFIDTSRVTLLSQGLSVIESLLVPLLRNDHVDAVGGPAIGAIPLVTLMARHQWAGFYVRRREQAHGRPWAIGGSPPEPGMSVALIDDLAATGASLRACLEVVQRLGAEVVSLYALVDREQGTRERFAARGLSYRPLITLSELVKHATKA
jgi:orotate phosphoribosyltransferase